MKRLVWMGALVAAASMIAFACASLIGAGDLTCSSDDAAPYTLDPCVGESGVAILPLSGEMHDLVFVPDAALVGVGFVRQQDASIYAVQLFSSAGELDAGLTEPVGTANSVILQAGEIFVVGGAGDGFLARGYTLDPFAEDKGAKATFTNALDKTVLGEGVVIRSATTIPTNVETLFGTSATGGLAVLRLTVNPATDARDVIYNASIRLRARDGFDITPPDGSVHLLTMLGDTPDASSLGLAIVRFEVATLNLDLTFNDGGVLIAPFSDGGGSARAMVPDGMDHVWVAGQAAGASGFVMARINWNGTIDKTYGQGGFVVSQGTNRGANAMMSTSQGLLVAGVDNGKMALARFTFDAGLDPTFGNNGVLTLGVDGELRTLTQTRDHIVAGGFAKVDGGTQWALVWLLR